HVCDEMMGRVEAHVHGGVAGVRATAPGAALVEQYDAVALGIEGSSHALRAPDAWSTVNDERRLTPWVSAGFPVNRIAVRDFEHAAFVRRELREELDGGGGGRIRADRHVASVAHAQCARIVPVRVFLNPFISI